jgi:hypothetical protein
MGPVIRLLSLRNRQRWKPDSTVGQDQASRSLGLSWLLQHLEIPASKQFALALKTG